MDEEWIVWGVVVAAAFWLASRGVVTRKTLNRSGARDAVVSVAAEQGRGPAPNSKDENVVRNVNRHLSTEDTLRGAVVAVDFRAGRVTLQGVVTSLDQKQRAERVAGSVEGVTQVDNHVRVES